MPTSKKPVATTRLEWNRGATGQPVAGRPVTAPGSCPTENCGAIADSMDESARWLTGWTRSGVYGSAEPDRVWCSGACAAYGIALAELRMEGATNG